MVPAALGVSGAEREMRRPVEIDAELHADLRRAGTSDRLADTVEYEQIYRTIESVAGQGEYRLVEALAESISQALLKEFPLTSCTIWVRKVAPIAGHLRHAGVRITRSRPPGSG